MPVVVLLALTLLLLPGSAASQQFPVQAGTGVRGFSGDGGPAVDAQLAVPSAVFVDVDGNITIADTSNDRVRLVGSDGTIRTLAGTGDRASTGDGGPECEAVETALLLRYIRGAATASDRRGGGVPSPQQCTKRFRLGATRWICR